ncbi:MAG: L-methionine gamma-lyase [Rhodocyclaceae bacterium]|nr:MAG: aminotransferase class I/II-fold pyridoxal phosphate-dependent enzyme [Rhodocyclaceae bacterium]MBV6408492.1 L-methionine gamma-lyase [Rhodocyclaceae bacterium]CAG0929595.1 cystathionine gamma-synthase [Rhodocyclaceae bacterium]
MSEANQGLSTRCVHAGEIDDAHGSPHTPVYTTTTFKFASTADVLDVVDGRKAGALYTRYGLNPTIFALEAKLAALEGAEAAWAFCSGMAAEAALFFAHGSKGIACLGDAYGGTLELLGSQLPQYGVRTHLLLGNELDLLEAQLREGCGLVFLETPTNPRMEIFDIAAIAELAHRHGARLAVDNTFASPVNQNPLALGADFVVHSATKYLGGHSDITAGALMGSKALLAPVWNWRKNLGQMVAPETAALLSRSLRTLVVRVERQNATAQAVAEAMARHSRVERVYYPGLPGFHGHALAKRQMKGFGGMLGIEVKGGGVAATRVADRLKLFALAPSLGGAESLVTQPCTTTHHGLPPEERARRGIADAMLRLSIGLEDAADLIADLDRALEE